MPSPAEALPPLLAPDEPGPVETVNPGGGAPFVLVCEHAGRALPRALGDLGLPESELTRHIAWDIGAREVALALAARLDAPLFLQRYSRLVCDCNRRPEVASFIPEVSEATRIPGNTAIGPAERARRAAAIFHPFHEAVAAALDARAAAGRPTALVTIHSFTPVFHGERRPWEIGVLWNRDRRFAPALLGWLRANTGLHVGANEPYSVGDETDYAIPVHGEARGIPCVEFEIRNDLASAPGGAERWAGLLARALSEVWRDLGAQERGG